jgi:transposase
MKRRTVMPCFAALDVSKETTAICVVDDDGTIIAETTIATCPDLITSYLRDRAPNLSRVGLETGPLAVWLWNELAARRLPVLCIDARHANAALKMRPVKTDRNDAAGLAQIMRVGWFKQVRIKSHDCYQVRSLLTARETLVRIRVKIENELRGLLRTFGVLFGKRVGGFTGRAHEIICGESEASPEMRARVRLPIRVTTATAAQLLPTNAIRMSSTRSSPGFSPRVMNLPSDV